MTQCQIVVGRGNEWDPYRPCGTSVAARPIAGLDLCFRHRDRLLAEMDREYGERFGASVKSMKRHIRHLEREIVRYMTGSRREAAEYRRTGLVYFVRRDGFVKIGTTTNLPSRLVQLSRGGDKRPEGMTLGPVELLATESGGQARESALHRKFRRFRVAGEWFTEAPEIMAHIATLTAAEAA